MVAELAYLGNNSEFVFVVTELFAVIVDDFIGKDGGDTIRCGKDLG
jgi:hypothetical protein